MLQNETGKCLKHVNHRSYFKHLTKKPRKNKNTDFEAREQEVALCAHHSLVSVLPVGQKTCKHPYQSQPVSDQGPTVAERNAVDQVEG